MAIGAGTDIAMECANIVLIKSDLVDVLTALDLARTTYRRILLNFVWALFFNGLGKSSAIVSKWFIVLFVGIPLAAGVFYPLFRWTLPPEAAGTFSIQ
jgi:Cu+-exporting ATPase